MTGETELVTDTNNHSGKKDQTCNGGLQSYCCGGFKTPPTKSDLEAQIADAAKDAAEATAEQLALDIAAKAFCRIAVPALLAPLELIEDLIPIVGKFPITSFVSLSNPLTLFQAGSQRLRRSSLPQNLSFSAPKRLRKPARPSSKSLAKTNLSQWTRRPNLSLQDHRHPAMIRYQRARRSVSEQTMVIVQDHSVMALIYMRVLTQ